MKIVTFCYWMKNVKEYSMNRQSPSVSVCIPAYCGERYIGATIQSVLDSSLSDFELIIIDDNSEDKTSEVVKSFTDSRIRYVRNSLNLGPEGNWNRCLKEAKGAYFKLLPQDDMLLPNTLENQVEILEKDHEESIALVFGSRIILDTKGKKLIERGYSEKAIGRTKPEDLIRACVVNGTNLIGEPGSGLIRASLIEKIGVYDGSVGYVIDVDYWVRALQFGDAWYTGEAAATFRVSSNSWSFRIGRDQGKDYRKFIRRVRAKYPDLVSNNDVRSGYFMSWLNGVLRQVFYRLFIK